MAKGNDDGFSARADAHIRLANEQVSDTVHRGQVSASLLYSAARFNAWVSACGFDNAEAMSKSKAETVDYFVAEYRKLLEDNLDHYISKFEKQSAPPDEGDA